MYCDTRLLPWVTSCEAVQVTEENDSSVPFQLHFAIVCFTVSCNPGTTLVERNLRNNNKCGDRINRVGGVWRQSRFINHTVQPSVRRCMHHQQSATLPTHGSPSQGAGTRSGWRNKVKRTAHPTMLLDPTMLENTPHSHIRLLVRSASATTSQVCTPESCW